MTRFSVDYSNLQDKLSKKKAFRLSDVKERIRKVAFDVVRFIDSDKIDDLWQIQRDGEDEYIVAMYNDNEQTEKVASVTNWKVLPDNSGGYVSVFFRNEPIKRIALAPLGIPTEDAWLVSKSISEKLASDQSYLRSFIQELSPHERKTLDEIEPAIKLGQ